MSPPIPRGIMFRIPMRGYEVVEPEANLTADLVPNPHERL